MRVVAGRLVVACDVQSPSRRIPVNLFIDYDAAHGLQLDNRAAGALRIERSDGSSVPITIRFPEWSLTVPRREIGDQALFEDFTKYHSVELGENALVGSIGAEVLREWRIVFDLPRGVLELRPASTPPADDVTGPSDAGTIECALTTVNGLAWLPVRHADGAPGAMAIGTSRYDTTVDLSACATYRAPDGHLESLAVNGFDLTERVPLRPADVVQVHPDGVAGVIGLNLLEQIRLEIDPGAQRAWITPRRPAELATWEYDCFLALRDQDPEAIEAYLTAHPESRLGPEAAEALLTIRLEEEADGAVVSRALQWINDTAAEDLRATRLLDLMRELRNEGFDDEVIAAGKIAVASGRDDRYPNTVHEIHGMLGTMLLARDADRDAWRHLLSAAFGLPEDGPINLALGRYYERAGRHRRAFSRYLQAVIKPESAADALAGMERTQGELDEPFSLELIERMIAGKVQNFGAAGRYAPDPETRTSRVALVEFFTNANLGDATRGAIGGALGNQGLISHFEPTEAVFLSHHLPQPGPDALVTNHALTLAREFGVESPTVHLINGVHVGPGAARWRQAEGVYQACRDVIIGELATPTEYTLTCAATIDAGVITGTLTIEGPAFDGLLAQVIVAERGVIAPGKSEVVIHRHVARGSALGDDLGVPYAPEANDRQVLRFSCRLADLEAANRATLDELAAAGAGGASRFGLAINADEVTLVAYVRRDISGEVMQATSCTPAVATATAVAARREGTP